MYHMTITGFLLYFLLIMIFTAIQTEVFINDCKAFFSDNMEWDIYSGGMADSEREVYCTGSKMDTK